jgi:hypothetical protein
MSDTLKSTEEPVNETSGAGRESSNTEPDPTCCRAPGEPDGGPDT